MRYCLLFVLPTLLLFVFACGDGLEQREETDALGFRTVYQIDPATGQREGMMRMYDPQGNLASEEHYAAGKLEGKRRIYAPGGVVIVEENYKADAFDGPFATFDSTGTPASRGQYVDGKMAKAWFYYYPNGQVKEVVTFADNAENGPFREWYADGTPRASGSYANGDNEQGILHLYAENGQLERVMDCNAGVCATFWTPDSTAAAPAGPDMTAPPRAGSR